MGVERGQPRSGVPAGELGASPEVERETMTTPTNEPAAAFDFDHAFARLSGHAPFPWQRRLFHEFCEGSVPRAVDIPTGLGKTAVMACWLLARANGAPLPRRLLYVVDRRVVVDQATEIAEGLRDRLDDIPELRERLGLGTRKLPISTLRGQHLDNREWMEDPVATSIIVGTVDMIGSRILFSGYGVSRKMRPNAAGLLGCDSLVVLDEAHLSHPFERLLAAIQGQRRISGTRATGKSIEEYADAAAGPGAPPPFRVLPLSATHRTLEKGAPFQLDGEDRSDPTVDRRLNAHKTLRVTDVVKGTNLEDALAEAAWSLYSEETDLAHDPVRVLVFCNSRDVAEKVAGKLKAKLKEETSDAETILFTGARRVRERQKAATELQECGLVGADGTAPTSPVILVATSAGEVGVDLDADHMVCDLVPWERMVQRLGRVNRRGTKAAKVHVIDGGESPKDATSTRLRSVRQLISMLPQANGDGHQAGPGAIAELSQLPAWGGLLKEASTPAPLYPALTKRLVEAWSLTSLAEHTGRPLVGPWLRGWVDDDPQTSVAWRRFLPLRFQGEVLEGTVRQSEVETFFEEAPLLAGELLETETWRVADWLKKRVRKVLRSIAKTQANAGPESSAAESESEVPEDVHPPPLGENSIVALLLDNAGKFEKGLSLKRIAGDPAKLINQYLAGRRLVVDARLGGIQDDGLLDATCDTLPTTADDRVDTNLDDNWGTRTVRVRLVGDASRGNDSTEESTWREVLALPYQVSEQGEENTWLVVEKPAKGATSEDSRAVASRPQELGEHQSMVVAEVARIADGLKLDRDDRAMLIAAAAFHDAGKDTPRWQRAFNARPEGGPYAKTSGPLNLGILNGYRHEFRSVLVADSKGLNGIDRASSRYDLALHLIAAHHGNARPAIGIEGCDKLPPTAAARRAREMAERFACLQRKLGPWGLAWWESLLRAADRRASGLHEERTRPPRVARQESDQRSSSDDSVTTAQGELDLK